MHQISETPLTEIPTRKRAPKTIDLLLTIVPSDEILGLMYIGGSASERPKERPRPTLDAGVEYL